MNRLLCGAALACLWLGAAALGDDAKDDSKQMKGTWKPATAELAGNAFPEQILKMMKLVLDGDKYYVTVGQAPPDEGTVKLDPAKSPKAMEIQGTKGPNQGKKIPAIYELKGDTLRICYDLSGQEHPKEFKSKPETQLFLVEYRREKN